MELLHCGCQFSDFVAFKESAPGWAELSVAPHVSLEQLFLPWVLLLIHLA